MCLVKSERTGRAVELQQFGEIRGGKTSDRVIVTNAFRFAFDPFGNRDPVKLLCEGCAVMVAHFSESRT